MTEKFDPFASKQKLLKHLQVELSVEGKVHLKN